MHSKWKCLNEASAHLETSNLNKKYVNAKGI